MAWATCGRACPCRPSSRQVLMAAALAIGILCHHTIATSDSFGHDGQNRVNDRALLWGRRGLVAGNGKPASSLTEQAFAATFGDKYAEDVPHVLDQHAQLVRWVEETSKPNASKLAFIPELGSDTALSVMRAGVQLSVMDVKQPDAIAAALRAICDQLRSASPWFGFPATRRLLIGALLKKRTEFGGSLPSSLQPYADDLLRQLFALHKTSVANRGAVQFFHISKSGGTNLCQAAEANGCASQGFDTKTNCLIRDFYDQPRWVTYSAHKFVQYRMSSRQALPWFVNFHTFRPPYTCEQRRAYLLREHLTFYANEYTNPPGTETSSEMCPDFVNLIMFRHPHDRLRSQIGWVQKLYKEYYLDVDTQPAFVNRTTGFWERMMPAAVNNYYIRSLLGQRFFEFPVLQVAPEHVELAKLAALQHDVLLTLEAMDRNELALRSGLGWATALKDGAVRSSTELGDAVALPLDFDDMLERNAPDVEVFAFARDMQALDTVLWSFAAAGGLAAVPAQAAAEGPVAELAPGGGGCGYVSQGSPAAAAELEKRLQGVEIPVPMVRAGSSPSGVATFSSSRTAGGDEEHGGSNSISSSEGAGVGASRGASASVRAAVQIPVAARPGGPSGSGNDVSADGKAGKGPETASGAGATGAGAKLLRAGGVRDSKGGSRGPSVVSLARRSRQLLRLKGLPAFVRSKQQQQQQQ